MDIDETRQAYERATHMDLSTALDMINDVQEERNAVLVERNELLRELAKQKRKTEEWRRIADKVFTFHTGCLDGCRRGLMCTCGFEHYRALYESELSKAKRHD